MSLAANLAEKLVTEHDLSEEELLYLLEHRQEVAPFVQEQAQKLCQEAKKSISADCWKFPTSAKMIAITAVSAKATKRRRDTV